MFSLPMIIVWFIAIAVVVIVALAALSHRTKGEPIGMAVLTLAAITFWVTGLILGFFVTHFSSPTPETWWWALAVRVGWQVGGAVFFGIMLLADSLLWGHKTSWRKPAGWIVVAICMAFGALLNLNPIRDMVEGPIAIRGAADIDVIRRPRNRGGWSIRAEMNLVTPEGKNYRFNMAGWPATKTEELLEKCENTNDVEIIMLRQMERVIDARC